MIGLLSAFPVCSTWPAAVETAKTEAILPDEVNPLMKEARCFTGPAPVRLS